MATHTYTLVPRVLNDGSGITLSAGGTAGGGATLVVVLDDAVATSKAQIIRELRLLEEYIQRDTWPPSV